MILQLNKTCVLPEQRQDGPEEIIQDPRGNVRFRITRLPKLHTK